MSSSIPPKKKKIKTLLEILSNSKNNEEVENIINHIKKEKIKLTELHNKPYFNIILNTVFSYYDLNRDKDTEELYNYLLQLIETSVSS
jgi:hypothetical protein